MLRVGLDALPMTPNLLKLLKPAFFRHIKSYIAFTNEIEI